MILRSPPIYYCLVQRVIYDDLLAIGYNESGPSWTIISQRVLQVIPFEYSQSLFQAESIEGGKWATNEWV